MHVDPGMVKRLAQDLGFALCGVAPAAPSDYQQELRDWLAAGKHAEMGYLAEHVQTRLDPRELLPGASSIICVADQIPTDAPAGSEQDVSRPGRIAAYAQINDYHKVMKKRLFALADRLREHWPDHQYKACVDTAPVLEREHAMRAGLGWVGKNTLMLHPRRGSHLLLGELVTTLELAPDVPQTDHCGTCTRCIDACPTQCITPYSVDASRCISYLNIEHRNEIDIDLHEPMGDWLYGCDVCQEVCPFNRREQPGSLPEKYDRRPGALNVGRVLDWSEEDRRLAFTKSAMKRAKLPQMKRNALIVAGNLLKKRDDPALRERIEAVAGDPDEPEMVRRTALQVLERMAHAIQEGGSVGR